MSRSRREIIDSPSKRLRATFYILWQQDDEGYDVFDDYYDVKMTKLVDYYKKLIKK